VLSPQDLPGKVGTAAKFAEVPATSGQFLIFLVTISCRFLGLTCRQRAK
jgi:hypothetical protein